MKDVSVIIPAYNSAICLEEAIDSALSQEWPAMEVIVINDGSTDATAEVARRYGKRIVYLEQPNLGQGAARNAGLRVARGELIAFLDADDYWKPQFLKVCVQFLSAHPEAAAVSTGLVTKMFDGSEVIHPEEICGDGATQKEPFIIENFFDYWARFDHVRTGSNVIRHSVIKKAGMQRDDLRISQDLEYWGYVATFGKWGFIPQPLWVGNSRQAARKRGWLAKLRARRRLCPNVEDWARRIEPRLTACEREGYAIVRGRVALTYAQSKILAWAWKSAHEVVKKYGSTMPSSRMSRVMLTGARFGQPGWLVACNTICLKEWVKAFRLRLPL